MRSPAARLLTWAVLLCVFSPRPAPALPEWKEQIRSLPSPLQKKSFVLDRAGILGQKKSEIDSLCKAMYDAGGAQIAVVTLSSLGEANIEEVAVELFSHWGIGEVQKDNGILLLHATDARKVRIEVGYGLEGVLPDAKANWIIQDVGIPRFKNGEFAEGHYYMVQSLLRVLLQPTASRSEIIEEKDTISPGQKISPDQIPDALYLSDKEEREIREKKKTEGQAGPGYISLAFMALGYLSAFWLLVRTVGRYSRLRTANMDPKKKYDAFDDAILEHSAVGVFLFIGIIATELGFLASFWSTIGLPLAVIAAWLIHDRYLKGFRNAPRLCSQCSAEMERLSEESDDAYLAAGQIEEEKAGSVDYDVWICHCGHARIERYRTPGSDNPCPSCQYLTYELVETITTRKPNYDEAGQGKKVYRCSHCDYEKEETFEIPRLKYEHETASGMAKTLAGAALAAALTEASRTPHSSGISDSDSLDFGPHPGPGADFDIPEDFGGGESGGGGATGDY